MSRATLTTGAKVLERRLKNRRLPDVPIPTTENPELARSLEGVKEHLRMYEGDSGAPKERFVTLQEMEDAGLITADTKNKFSFIAQVQGQDVVQPAGTAVATVRNTVIKTTGGGAAKLNDLSDVNAAGVSRSFLYYNGSKWVHFDLFGTINVWEVSQTFNAGILIANAEGVNWFNLSEDPVELLQFSGVAATTELTHETVRLDSIITLNAAGIYGTVTGATLSGAAMNTGNDVLIYVQCDVRKASGGDNIFTKLTGPGGDLTGSESSLDTKTNGLVFGYFYGYSGKITADGSDVSLEGKGPSGIDTYWFYPQMMALDLTELGASAQYTESTTEMTDVTGGAWTATNSALTFGDGVKDFIVFWGSQVNQDSNLSYFQFRLNDGAGTTHFLGGFSGGGTAEIFDQAGLVVLAAHASATWTLEYFHVAGFNASDVTYTSLCAIDLDAFEDHLAVEEATPNASWANNDIEVTGNKTTSTSAPADWLVIGAINTNDWGLTTEGASLQLQSSLTGSGGLAGMYDMPGHSIVAIPLDTPRPFTMFDDEAAVPNATDFYVQIQHATGEIPAATTVTDNASIAAFTWNLVSSLEESFIVGDPVYPTQIDGLTTNITSAATDIDGTLNVDGTSAFNADVDLTTNAILTIWDAANTDKATITIKGDDLDIVGVGLSDLDIGGFTLARFQDVNVRISSSVGDTNYIEFEADGTDILATCYGTGSFIFRDIPDWIWIEDGCGLSIGADQTGTKNLYMFHDGTDFEFDFDGTTDWNISGITNMQLAANLVATGNIGFAGKLNANTTLVTTTTHTAAAEHVILVDDDTAAATVTVTLPLAATANTVYHIKKLGTTASVIVDGNGTETIDGALTATLNIQYESIMLVSDGSNWHVI